MKRFVIAITTALLLTACSDASMTMDADGVVTDAAMPSVLISDGYIMAPLKGRDVAAGYFIAENQGAAISLVSASTPMAATVELHTHSMVDGVMKMRKVEAVDLAEEGSVAFEPGSFHLMMFGFSRAEGQTETPVTVVLSTGEQIVVSLPIRERG
ncbi:MAG: copper chaperone PCu(A)C [Litorimonas sp.]